MADGGTVMSNFYSKINQMHNISNFILFWNTLRISDGLSVHHQESKTVHTASGIWSCRFCGCILFWNNTLHVSDDLFVHRQESKTVHTASGTCHIGFVAAATEPV